jgi:hypothetical protein
MTEEIWMPIPGFNGFYEASSHGRIRSKDRLSRSGKALRRMFGRILVPQLTGRRYPVVSLSLDGEVKSYVVHRLVAKTFIPNPDNLPEINHKDGDKTNSRPDNLEWCSRAQNNDHAIQSGLKPPVLGSRHGRSKLTEDQVLQIRQLHASCICGSAIAAQFKISPTTVSQIWRRMLWTHI